MPECHKCQHDGKGRRACLTCPGPSDAPNHKGRSHISIDAITGENMRSVESMMPAPTTQEPEPEHPASAAVRWIAHLPPQDTAVLQAAIKTPDASIREIGRQTGYSTRKVAVAMRRIVASVPVEGSAALRGLFRRV